MNDDPNKGRRTVVHMAEPRQQQLSHRVPPVRRTTPLRHHQIFLHHLRHFAQLEAQQAVHARVVKPHAFFHLLEIPSKEKINVLI